MRSVPASPNAGEAFLLRAYTMLHPTVKSFCPMMVVLPGGIPLFFEPFNESKDQQFQGRTMMTFEHLGIGVDGTTSTSETLALAKRAEASGFHSFWLSEGYHSRSAIVRASVIATGTERIRI